MKTKKAAPTSTSPARGKDSDNTAVISAAKAAGKTLAKPSAKTAAKPAAKSTAKPTATSAAKPVVKPSLRAAAKVSAKNGGKVSSAASDKAYSQKAGQTKKEKRLDLIDHIAIPVEEGEVDATVDFYLENFGCSVIYRDESWAFLRFGNIKLAFVVPSEHPPHLAFISPRADQFGKLKTHRDGTRSVYISDPSDNTIEIMAES